MTTINLQKATLVYDQTQARGCAITVVTPEGTTARLECVRDLDKLTVIDVVGVLSALQKMSELDNDSCESVNGDTL